MDRQTEERLQALEEQVGQLQTLLVQQAAMTGLLTGLLVRSRVLTREEGLMVFLAGREVPKELRVSGVRDWAIDQIHQIKRSDRTP